VSNFPFGFNPGSHDDDNDDSDNASPADPLASLLGGGGDIGAAFQ